MKKILVAVDGSPAADHAATEARRLFGDDADFLAVNVVPGPPPVADPIVGFGMVYAYAPYSGDPSIDEAARVGALDTAADTMDHAGIGHAEVIADVGDPAMAIIRAAEEHAVDVIVVASSEKGWFSRLLLGSVADSVVKRSPVPVLVVH